LYWIPRIGAAAIAAALSLLWQPFRPQNLTDEYVSRFEHETNPVHRAKLLPKLGDSEFITIQKDVADGDVPAAVAVLQRFRDQAQTCIKDLDARESDAERHPSGFKELQISLRESLRRLDGLMGDMTRDQQEQFAALRQDLDQMNRHVIRELFPRQPDNGTTPEKPKG
jgi:hypothetical protein